MNSIRTIRLNSFRPLCSTPVGLQAMTKYNLPPFIDGSCRREPDFENVFPSITALCRQGSFARHLYPDDIVVYITTKGKWFADYAHYRLIAILLVAQKMSSHSQAASWYKRYNYNLIPSNCMIPENPPIAFDRTSGNFSSSMHAKRYLGYTEERKQKIGDRRIEIWDTEYLDRAGSWGDFIITKTLFKNYLNPPVLTVEEMKGIFGKVPSTQNPKKINREELIELGKYVDINFKRG